MRYIFSFDKAIVEGMHGIKYDSVFQNEDNHIDQERLEDIRKIESMFEEKDTRLDKISKLMAIRPGKLWILIDPGPIGRNQPVTYLLKLESAQLNVYRERRDLERQDMQGKNRRVVILVSIDVNNSF